MLSATFKSTFHIIQKNMSCANKKRSLSRPNFVVDLDSAKQKQPQQEESAESGLALGDHKKLQSNLQSKSLVPKETFFSFCCLWWSRTAFSNETISPFSHTGLHISVPFSRQSMRGYQEPVPAEGIDFHSGMCWREWTRPVFVLRRRKGSSAP